jgi:gluconate 2-dehydrogenase gamma chain
MKPHRARAALPVYVRSDSEQIGQQPTSETVNVPYRRLHIPANPKGVPTQSSASEGDPDKSVSVDEYSSLTRRSLLNAALLLPAAGMFGCNSPASSHPEEYKASSASLFFNPEERVFVEAATERLIPDEEDGLGARAAAVVVFIDRQLAGSFGRAEKWYMQGPWAKGTPEQGYQLKLNPGELYQTAIHDVNAWCQQNHAKSFALLAAAEQDDVLHGLEGGEIELPDVPAKVFFTMLWNNTVEGFLADPMYGGNRNFTGWKLVGFPGPRYNYVSEIEQYGKPYTLPTVGILGRDGSRLRKG